MKRIARCCCRKIGGGGIGAIRRHYGEPGARLASRVSEIFLEKSYCRTTLSSSSEVCNEGIQLSCIIDLRIRPSH